MADPRDEITTQDILAQYGPTPQAKPKDEHGFLFSNVGGELKFNPWEHIKGFMGYRAPPGALSTSGDSKPIEDAFNAAGWVGLSGMGLNAFGAVPANAVGSAGARLAGKAMPAVERELDPLGFYSAALEGAKTWPMERGSPQQALAHLKKSGTKDAEISATGLDKYLAEQDVVSRQALENYLRENRVKVERDRYGGHEPDVDLTTMERNRLDDGQIEHVIEDSATGRTFYMTEDRDAGNVFVQGPSGVSIPVRARVNNQDPADGMEAIHQWMREDAKPNGVVDYAQYADYSGDPYNPTYRENILRLGQTPKQEAIEAQITALEKEHSANAKRINKIQDGDEKAFLEEENARLIAERRKLRQESYRLMTDTYDEGHFTGRGIISHSQTAIQPDINDRNWMTPWQIQSDWGQRLRRGARDDARIAEYDNQIVNLRETLEAAEKHVEDLAARDGFNILDGRGRRDPFAFERYLKSDAPGAAEAAKIRDQHIDMVGEKRRLEAERAVHENNAPSHPLVNTTDQWVTTQLRHVLQQAAEADAHGVALPQGHTILDYNPGDAEGMSGFYDKIVPKIMAKELRRLDPTIQQEQVRLVKHDEPPGMYRGNPDLHASDYERTAFERPFYGYPLTDKAKEEIRRGLPLFQQGIPVADLLRAYYGEEKE